MIAVYQLSPGAAGVDQILATLNLLREHYGRLPAIRAAAICIIRGVGNDDQAAQIHALAQFVRECVRYLSDPINAEFIQTPDRMLLEIAAHGYTYGDCDDHALLFAALAEAIGIPCEIRGVQSGAGPLADHVVTVAHLEAGDLEFDLIQK